MRERAHGENWRGSLTLTEPPFRSSLRGGPYPRPHVAIGTGQPQPSSHSNSRPRTGSLHCPPLRAHSRAPLRAGEEATPPPPGAPVNAPRARVWSWPLVPHPTCPSPTQRRARSRRLEWRHPADGGGVGGRSGSAQGPAPLPVPLDGSAPGLAPEPGCPPLGDGDSSPHVSTHARRIPTRDPPRPGLGARDPGNQPAGTRVRGERARPRSGPSTASHTRRRGAEHPRPGPPQPPGPASCHLRGPTSAPLAPAPDRTGAGCVRGRPGHSPRSAAAAALASPPRRAPRCRRASARRAPPPAPERTGSGSPSRPAWPLHRAHAAASAGPPACAGPGSSPAGGAMGPHRAPGTAPRQPARRAHQPHTVPLLQDAAVTL